MMLYSRLAAVLLCGVTLFAVAACSDDPGSVGPNLGSDGSTNGVPSDTTIAASSTDTLTSPSRTGLATEDGPWRVLTGTVTDPLAGTIEATGYVDFDSTLTDEAGTLPTADAADLNAELQLSPSYVHGDTTQDVDITLFDLTEQAAMDRAPSDTTFPAAPSAIKTHSVSPTASTVTIPLSQWIDNRQSELQGDSFSNFYGFQLATTSGNEAVVGFEHGSATLRVTTPEDTATFSASQSFTNIDKTASASISSEADDRRLLVDGVGTGLTFDWADNSVLDSLATTNDRLNRAVLTVPVDASFGSKPADFARPSPSGYRILAIKHANSPDCSELNLASRSVGGTAACALPTDPSQAPNDARASRAAAFDVFDEWFDADARPFAEFRVEIANRTDNPSDLETTRPGLPSTIPVTVRIPALSTFPLEDVPRVELTRTPL